MVSDSVLANGNLSGRNTLGLTAHADRVVAITQASQLEQALTDARPFGPITVLGGGKQRGDASCTNWHRVAHGY